jgi:ABC-type sugar transport system permease subunit
MGYASALAWLFALLIIVLTWVQMRLARSWVYYGGEK